MTFPLEDLFYAGASGRASWDEVAVAISNGMEAAGAALLLHHGTQISGDISFGVSTIERSFHEIYLDQFAAISPLGRHVQRGNADRIFTSEEVLGDRLVETDFYRGFLRPYRLRHQIAQFMTVEVSTRASVVFYRTLRQGPFESPNRQFFEAFTRPLYNALNVYIRLQRAEQAAAAGFDALDSQATALFVLDGRMEVLRCNARGEYLRSRYGLFGRPWRLSRYGTSFSQHLIDAIANGKVIDCICLGEAGAKFAGRVIPTNGVGSRALTLILREIGRAKSRPWGLIQQSFDLSAAELRILRMLVDDDRPGPALAAALGLSAHTLKTHRANVYSKLAVENRQALVQLIDSFGF